MDAITHTTDHSEQPGHGSHADQEANTPKVYAAVLACLVILTFITVGASYIHFGSGMVNVVVALTIVTIKATLVALFFMHLLHDRAVNATILLTSFAFLALFLGACYTDISSRENLQPANWKVPAPAAPAPGKPVSATPTAPALPAAAGQHD